MAKFTSAVLEMAHNPKALAQFKHNPEGASVALGLSTEQVDILTSNNVSKIHRAIADEIGDTELGGEIVAIVIVVK